MSYKRKDCKNINLVVQGEEYPVIKLWGEEKVCEPWILCLTIRLPINCSYLTWLSNKAKCEWIEKNQKKIFVGEIISIIEGSHDNHKQTITIRLSSVLHQLSKNGGAIVFKNKSFREVVSEILKKNRIFLEINIVFCDGIGLDTYSYIQQFSSENDLSFINRYCKKRDWFWVLRMTDENSEKMIFFKKIKSLVQYTRFHQGLLNDTYSLKESFLDKNADFFDYAKICSINTSCVALSGFSSLVGLGDRCEPIGNQYAIFSITHHFDTYSEDSFGQYHNTFKLSDYFNIIDNHESNRILSAPFQYGFILNDSNHACIEEQGSYPVELLSHLSLSKNEQEVCQISPLLGYGGDLSYYLGFPTGMQGLWHGDSEVLLALVNNSEEDLKICGTLSSRCLDNPVTSVNKYLYEWRTPENISLLFSDLPKQKKIKWKVKNNFFTMGTVRNNWVGIDLFVKNGKLDLLAHKNIEIELKKEIKELVHHSKHEKSENNFKLLTKKDKIHYQTLEKCFFDIKNKACLKSMQSHWSINNIFSWISESLYLDVGEELKIQVEKGNISSEAMNISIEGDSNGQLLIFGKDRNSGITISNSGKITLFGKIMYFYGQSTIKGNVFTDRINMQNDFLKKKYTTVELKQPDDLTEYTAPESYKKNIKKMIFDPFSEKTDGNDMESGWINSTVKLNDFTAVLQGMNIEHPLEKKEKRCDFKLSEKIFSEE